jgi:hypothetical protein
MSPSILFTCSIYGSRIPPVTANIFSPTPTGSQHITLKHAVTSCHSLQNTLSPFPLRIHHNLIFDAESFKKSTFPVVCCHSLRLRKCSQPVEHVTFTHSNPLRLSLFEPYQKQHIQSDRHFIPLRRVTPCWNTVNTCKVLSVLRSVQQKYPTHMIGLHLLSVVWRKGI